MLNMIVIKKLCLFSVLLYLISGCTATMQYTAVLDIDGKVLKNPPVEDKISYGRFEDAILELTDRFVYQDVEIYISPTQRCTQWLFGFIKIADKLGCPLSLSGGEQYSIFMEIENTSSRPIVFYADRILLTKGDEVLPYDLKCTNQIVHFDKDRQVNLKDGEEQLTLMPGDHIEIKISLGDWSNIGDRFQMNLSDALSTDEIVNLNMERFTVHKIGLSEH